MNDEWRGWGGRRVTWLPMFILILLIVVFLMVPFEKPERIQVGDVECIQYADALSCNWLGAMRDRM